MVANASDSRFVSANLLEPIILFSSSLAEKYNRTIYFHKIHVTG